MLVFDLMEIGNKLYAIRKQKGLTQAQVAEEAGLSDRTYADIERGSVNMRIESVLRICEALGITPNDIFVEDQIIVPIGATLAERVDLLPEKNRETAKQLLEVYLNSLE
ncbi:MAG: helix-turn-helix transcriptional regulator [Clostridia bacterium]|nr:helix-turn-helix transcriptional regulator [Clostridia bacterium]